ncbi:hypothetical protein QJS66_02880 [Kocuria rhizophila]|nr:hypothetical protein QJS66_02880 [Kocuria rhizophila]
MTDDGRVLGLAAGVEKLRRRARVIVMATSAAPRAPCTRSTRSSRPRTVAELSEAPVLGGRRRGGEDAGPRRKRCRTVRLRVGERP